MKYRLYEDSKNDTSNVVRNVLRNRGIKNYKEYLHLSSNCEIPYSELDNIDDAVKMFMEHFYKKNTIGIIPDSDVDGMCSSAMIYLYINQLYHSMCDTKDDYPIEIIYHKRNKGHGLSDVNISENVKLLIIADAGTNDTDECKQLSEKGIDIIILDHHEQEKDNPYAIIVNNQNSQYYSNKQLCGAGIVYKWLNALDDCTWEQFADNYLDLVALANISDVMDLREYETRYLVNTGLSNINNKFFKALIKAQDYSMNGKVNIHNVQWYLTPVINALIRIGTEEEREFLFNAFIEKDQMFDYKKRATKDHPEEIIQETIYDRAARLCKNAKSRQDKKRDKAFKDISEFLKKSNEENQVNIIDATKYIDSGLTGLVAIKIAETFHRPCILLNKSSDGTYGGSARNFNHSPISNFKDIVNEINVFNFAQGHQGAFGISIDDSKIDIAKEKLNELLKYVVYDTTYNVDFVLDVEEVDESLIIELSKFDDIICQGIDEPLIAVENISLPRDKFIVIGKTEDTITFESNGVKYIQFKCKEGNGLYDFIQDAWSDDNWISFTIVGKPGINNYNGVLTPQVIIEDVEVLNSNTISDDSEEDW